MADQLNFLPERRTVKVQLVGHPLHGKVCAVVDEWRDGAVVFVAHRSLPEPIGFHPTHLIGYG